MDIHQDPQRQRHPGEAKGTLFNIQRFSTEDGPGIRTTLFFKGCPLCCPWCQNPEGLRCEPQVLWQTALCLGCGDCVSACPKGAISRTAGGTFIDRHRCQPCRACLEACPTQALEGVGRDYGVEELVDEVRKDQAFYSASQGGITLSGGEPLAQPEFVLKFCWRCRSVGLHLALDTSGFAPPEVFQAALAQMDLVLFDLKLLDAAEHERVVGVQLEGILENLDRVVKSRIPLWVRTPIIPGFTDTANNLRAIARHLKAHAPGLDRWDLLAFSNLCQSKYAMLGWRYPLQGTELLTREAMERLTGVARDEGIAAVRWSGPTRVEPMLEVS